MRFGHNRSAQRRRADRHENIITISDEILTPEFRLFPNPVEDNLFISFQSNQDQSIGIQIIDTKGQVIISREVLVHNGNYIENIDVSNLNEGMYMVKVSGKTKKLGTRRFIVL